MGTFIACLIGVPVVIYIIMVICNWFDLLDDASAWDLYGMFLFSPYVVCVVTLIVIALKALWTHNLSHTFHHLINLF